MNDLFKREQRILNNANKYIDDVKKGKPFNIGEFESLTREYSRLLKQLRMLTKISDKTAVDLNTSKQVLLDKVIYDGLTGIFSRRYMEDSMKLILKKLSESGDGVISVLMIDVDHFKLYNDTYGHSKGDDCLKIIATTVAKSIYMKEDFAARYGGEEFVVILPNTSESYALMVTTRILEGIWDVNIPHEKNMPYGRVTVSIGTTTGIVREDHKSKDFVKIADKALYISKNSGRNKYTFLDFDDEYSHSR